jgi:NADH dehydrogenase
MNAALESQTNKAQPHVIIVGGGFGGLAAARALKDAPLRHPLGSYESPCFQLLLYQVATAGSRQRISPHRFEKCCASNPTPPWPHARVTRVDADQRLVFFSYLDGEERSLPYDYLILATGVQQSYFGPTSLRRSRRD